MPLAAADTPRHMHDGSAAVPSLRAAVRGAVDRGLDYLDASLRPGGEWPSLIYWNQSPPRDVRADGSLKVELEGPAEEELAPFVAAIGALTLAPCDDPRAKSIRRRSGEFIVRSMSYPGVWRYWPWLPNDLDSLSICSQAIPWHPWVMFAMNLPKLRAALDDRGRFKTWLASNARVLDVDSVINANVIGYLAAQGQNRLGERAAEWLVGLVRDGTAGGSSHYYPDTLDLYDAMARARARGVPALQDLGPALVDRIRARRETDGGYGDTLRTARSLSALHLLGAAPAGAELEAALELIVRRQRPDGSWPAACFSQGPMWPSPPRVRFACPMLDTASCIEALVRLGSADA